MSHSAGSKRSASPSATIRNKSGESINRSSKSLGQGSPRRQRSSSSRAARSDEIFANQQIQLFLSLFGNDRTVGDDGMRERRTALAIPRLLHLRHRLGHNLSPILRLLH